MLSVDLPSDRKALLFSAGGVRLALRLSHLREIVPAPADGDIAARGGTYPTACVSAVLGLPGGATPYALLTEGAPRMALRVEVLHGIVDLAGAECFQLPVPTPLPRPPPFSGAVVWRGEVALELAVPSLGFAPLAPAPERPEPPADLRVCEEIPGPSQASETRAALGATTEHSRKPCEGGATKRCEADRSPRRREGISSQTLSPCAERELCFARAGTRFAVPLSLLVQVLEDARLAPVPLTPPSHRGLLYHGRSLHPVLDLAPAYVGAGAATPPPQPPSPASLERGERRTPPRPPACVLLLDAGGAAVGILADRVLGVGECGPEVVRPPWDTMFGS